MKLKKLVLNNFRAFKHFECEFQQGINVLVGLNGQGKSSILDAIAIAYGQFFSAIGTGVDRGVHNPEIHQAKFIDNDKDSSFSMEHQFPVTIQCETHSNNIFPDYWERSRNTLKGRTTQVKALKDVATEYQNLVQDNKSVKLPMFGYYGTGRLWKQKKLSSAKAESLIKSSRLEGYRDCMDPESSYTSFARWLKEETLADMERTMRVIEESGLNNAVIHGSTLSKKLLDAISHAVNTVLAPSNWSNVRYSARAKEIVATHPEQGDVAVSMLSDGVRNMIGMVADIAYRCVRLNRHLGLNAVTHTHGLVLIDEVDMHLHPEWQQLILQNLTQAFPSIQFIVTTHSPQVLTTVKKESVHLLQSKDGKGWTQHPIGETYGIASQDALIEVMNVEPQPPIDKVKKLKEYMALIDHGTYQSEKGLALRSELEELYGIEHNELKRADRKIRRKGLLSS